MMANTKGPLIGFGRTAEVYAWGDDQVVKLYRPEMPREWVQREAWIGQIVADAGLHAPAVGGVVEIDGRLGVLYERVDGPSMLDTILPALKGGTLQSLEPAAQRFAELHAVMHDCVRLQLPPQRAGLIHAITHTPLPSQAKDRVLRRLDELPDGNAVCHGDYHPGNIVMTPAGPIIIDWVTACRGAPIADVTRTMLMQRVAQLPPEYGGAPRLAFEAGRDFFFATYLHAYLEHRPFMEAEIEAWMPVLAAARLYEGIENEVDLLLGMVGEL